MRPPPRAGRCGDKGLPIVLEDPCPLAAGGAGSRRPGTTIRSTSRRWRGLASNRKWKKTHLQARHDPRVVFHGVPKGILIQGRSLFNCQCHKTRGGCSARGLGLDESRFMLHVFQSRFGLCRNGCSLHRHETVEGAGAARREESSDSSRRASRRIAWRRLEEIAGENAEYFRHAGGENFAADSLPPMTSEGAA